MKRLTPTQLRVAGLAAVGVVIVAIAAVLALQAPAPVAVRSSLPPVTPSPTELASPSAEPSASPEPSPSPEPTSGIVAADLDGLLVDASVAHREPLAVMIDDAGPARPQAGFNAASEVWQSPVDGYESRYMMVFQEQDAPTVGPVRSARFFFAHWAAELDAGLAHYGGDRKTRSWLRYNATNLLVNLDGIGAANPAYHRVSYREAPHNAYTSTGALWRMLDKLDGPATIGPSVHLRPFRDDSPVDQRGTSQTISIPYRTETIGFMYDPTANDYLRSVNGRPQIDAGDHRQVTARTVIVLYMAFHTDSTIEPGHNRPVLGFTGSGVARVYMEGTLITGRWSKPTELAPTLILGPDGSELPLIRGRIFFEVVPLGTRVAS